MHELHTIPTLSQLLNLNPKLKTVFFDMDGTLLNTERLHSQAFMLLGQKLKIQIPMSPQELEENFKGQSDEQVFTHLAPWMKHITFNIKELIEQKNQSLVEMIAKLGPEDILAPAMSHLLKEIRDSGRQYALITSSERVVTEALLTQTKIKDSFAFILTLQDVLRPKPDPYPYLYALEKIQQDKNEILILEDSPTGLAAAQASGLPYAKVSWWNKII